MRISQQVVAIILSEEGQQTLRVAVEEIGDSPVVRFYVQDTDEIGIWVRHKRRDGDHLLLIRWEFVLSIDFPVGPTKTVGFETAGN